MKAWTTQPQGSAAPLALVDWPEATPGAGEILLRLHAVSLNYRDLINLEMPRPGNLPPPLIPCSDGAGEVVAVGAGVVEPKVGDRVAALFFRDWLGGPFDLRFHEAAGGGSTHGLLREYAVLPAHAVVPAPPHLSWEETATLPCAAVTAWQALFTRGQLRANETVLALGTGGVSTFGLQLATAAGARVIVTSSSEAKLARARELGAWEGINYTATPEWSREVWRLTEKHGVDHVLEVGGGGTLGQSMQAVAAGGQIALIGVLTGFGPPKESLFPLVARNVRLDGIYVGSRTDFAALNGFLAEHRIAPVIDRCFPFEKAPDAFAHLRGASHVGKVVVSIP